MKARAWAGAAAAVRSLWPLPLALYLARVALEASRRPWPGAAVVAVAAAAAAGGAMLGRRLAQAGGPALKLPARPCGRDAAWLLLAYVCWPSRAPLAACSVALLVALTWLLAAASGRGGEGGANGSRLLQGWPRWACWLADALVFAVALVIYTATLARDVLPADSGEFQLVAARWGVAHPPGFALYTMLGALFVRLLPWLTPAHALNLLSALLAAGTLLLVARATRTWARALAPRGTTGALELAGGVAAALALGSGTTFWAQATVANIRTPSVFCVALVLSQLARFAAATRRARQGQAADAGREADRALLWLGVGLGLGLGHHPSLVFAGVFYLLYIVLVDLRLVLRPRRWARLLVALPVGLLPLGYLPLRGAAGATLAPGGLDTLRGFLHHVQAEGFAGDMFAYANAVDLPNRLALVPTLWPFQLNTGLLLAGALGLLLLAWRDWRTAVLLAGSLALHTFVTITYRAPQTVEYLMPAAYPVLAIAAGLAPVLVGRRTASTVAQAAPRASGAGTRTDLSRMLAAFLAALVLCSGALNGWTHAPSFVELAADRSTRETVAPLLASAPPGALLLADWHWATPLWYLQQVEGVRPDVEVHYVYNVPGEEYRETWRKRVEGADPGRPLLVTHFYEFSGFVTEPWESGFRIARGPAAQVSAPLSELNVAFGPALKVLGYRVVAEATQPGREVEVVLAWQALQPLPVPHSLTLRLLGADGRWLAQADQALSAQAQPGEVRFERLVLPLYPWLAPGAYRLALGAYLSSGSGFEDLTVAGGDAGGATSAPLGELVLEPGVRAPYTLHAQSVPFAAGPTLVGVDYDRSQVATLRIYLRWRGPIAAGCQARLLAAGNAVASVDLPALPVAAFATVRVDVPGAVSRPALSLLCAGAPGAAPAAAAGAWGWALAQVPLPRAGAAARFVQLGAEMAVIGSRARTAPPGGSARIDVALVALRPMVDDVATSVRLMDAAGRWLARHDMQPALGAVPTLKWIRGSRVVDRHLLPVPAGYAGATVQAALVAYERFRERPLAVLDERFSQAPLGVWPQP